MNFYTFVKVKYIRKTNVISKNNKMSFLVLIVICLLIWLTGVQGNIPPEVVVPSLNAWAPDEIFVRGGATQQIQCRANGSATILFQNFALHFDDRYRWVVNGSDFPQDSSTVIYDRTSGQLSIGTRFGRMNNGQYQCIASNVFGATMTPSLRILAAEYGTFPGREDLEPEEVTVTTGSNVALTCQNVPYSVPPSTFKWRRAVNGLIADIEVIGADTQRFVVDSTGRLHILWVDITDSAIFSCSAYNEVLLISVTNPHTYRLIVHKAAEQSRPPKLIYKNGDRIKQGEDARLSCIFTYYSPGSTLDIQWLFDGRVVGSQYELYLSNVSVEQQGQYTCKALLQDQAETSVADQVQLIVGRPPDIKSNTTKRRIIPEGNDVTFYCDVQPNDLPIVWFINAKRLRENDRFQINRKGTVLFVRSVRRDTDNMCVQCTAENDFGSAMLEGCIGIIVRISMVKSPRPVYFVDPAGETVNVDAEAEDLQSKLIYRWSVIDPDNQIHQIDIATGPVVLGVNISRHTRVTGKRLILLVPQDTPYAAINVYDVMVKRLRYVLDVGNPYENISMEFRLATLDDKGQKLNVWQKPDSSYTVQPGDVLNITVAATSEFDKPVNYSWWWYDKRTYAPSSQPTAEKQPLSSHPFGKKYLQVSTHGTTLTVVVPGDDEAVALSSITGSQLYAVQIRSVTDVAVYNFTITRAKDEVPNIGKTESELEKHLTIIGAVVGFVAMVTLIVGSVFIIRRHMRITRRLVGSGINYGRQGKQNAINSDVVRQNPAYENHRSTSMETEYDVLATP